MMKIYKNQIITLFFSLFFSSTTFAIDFFEDGEDIIWKSGLNRYFKYTDQDESKFGKNDHPVELNENDVGLALKSLEFTEKNFLSREAIRTVFSASQIKLMSQQLAKGLKNAKPEQDIVFVMEGGSRKLILLNEKNFVAGRVFYKEAKLNIIIGEYDRARNDAFEKVYDPSGRAAVPYSFNYGRRSKGAKNFKGNVIGVSGVENKRFGNKSRQDWLVIDVALASKGYTARLNEENNPSAKRDRQFEIEAAKMSRQRREMRAEMARMRKEMKEMSSAPASKKSLQERMVTLEQLKKEELITQEEYDAKRKDILNDI